MTPIEAYIRQAAQKRGIDPDVAVRVARSEGGLTDPFRRGEGPAPRSQARGMGATESSFGPLQLYVSGTGAGLGDRALAEGIDPRTDWKGGVDFALNEAAQKGWGQWYGAAKAGIGNRTGIGGAQPADIASPLSPAAQDFVLNNPQPGGFGPGVSDPNNPSIFGSMSPGGGMMPQNNSIDPAVAAFAFDDKPTWGDRIGGAFTALGKEVESIRPPRPGPMGDARASGNALSSVMAGPSASEALLKKRMGFLF